MHSTILKGVHIGNNVIIGANSLVNKNIPDNCVVAGNPCRILMSLEEYYQKRKEAQIEEATELVKLYRERTGREADEKVMHEFFWLFTDQPDNIPEIWKNVNDLVGNGSKSAELLRNNIKKYDSMKTFLESIKSDLD